MDNLALNCVHSAEKFGGVLHVAACYKVADDRTADYEIVHLYGFNNTHSESEGPAHFFQRFDASFTALAKGIVIADIYLTDTDLLVQDIAGKIPGMLLGKGPREIGANHNIDSCRGKKFHLAVKGVQHHGRTLRGKHFQRMWLKCKYNACPLDLPGPFDQRGILEATIQVNSNYSFTAFVVHLKSRRTAPEADESEMRERV